MIPRPRSANPSAPPAACARAGSRRRAHPRPGIAHAPALAALLLALGCATPEIDQRAFADLAERLGAEAGRPGGTAFEVPPSVALDDGVTEDEAVALALWNAAEFRQELSRLGVARADWVAAGLLKNPSVQILFPVGAKQLEFTVAWILDALWFRGQRVDAARARWERGAMDFLEVALDRAQVVRLAHAAAVQARERSALAQQRASLGEQRDAIQQTRVRAGQVMLQQAAASHALALDARQAALAAERRAVAAERALWLSVGADVAEPATARWSLVAGPPAGSEPFALGAWLELARASRPALEAARLGVAEAGAQVGLARWQILRVVALVDANAKGTRGFEIGPGLNIEIPLFDQNQAGTLRAQTELERAAWAYQATQRRVHFEVLEAYANYAQAQRALGAWLERALPALETELAIATEHVQSGAAPFDQVLDARLGLLGARERESDLRAESRRALASFERSIGRRIDDAV